MPFTDRPRDELGILTALIYRETRYLRHYIGEVCQNDDPMNRGRVKVKVYELGWETEDVAAWCEPRQLHAMSVPLVGEWVEVYFMVGDMNRPVYLGQAPEILASRNTPSKFTDRKKHVVFENLLNGCSLWYDEGTGYFNFSESGSPEMIALGETLKTYIDSLKAWMDAHTHSAGTYTTAGGPVTLVSGAPSAASPDVSDFRSAKVKSE